MRRTIKIGAVLALLVTALWAAAATGVRQGYSHVTQAGGAGGVTAMAGGLSVRGFPLRVEAAVSDPELADAAAGWSWRGEGLSLSAPLWQPTRLHLDAPARHSVVAGGESVAMRNDSLEAALHVTASTMPVLRSVHVTAAAFEAVSDAGWQVALGTGAVRFVEEATETDPYRYRLEITGEDLAPPQDMLRQLDPGATLPDQVGRVEVQAHISFDQPLDMRALERGDLRPTRIEIDTMTAEWGEITLGMAGLLEIGADGWPDGTLTIRADGWQRVVGLIVALGLIEADARPVIEGGLMPLAMRDEDPAGLETEINFREDGLYVWPVPVPLLPAERP